MSNKLKETVKVACWLCGVGVLCALNSGCAAYGVASSWDGGVARMPSGRNTCAPDALAKYLEITQGYKMTGVEAVKLYEQARRVDGLDDEREGTSLYGVMKASPDVSSLIELEDVSQVIDALTATPVLLRLPYYRSRPSRHSKFAIPTFNTQFWAHDGLYVSDHLIVCIGYKGGLFKLMNNQGPCWGSEGCVWLWENHLDGWLKDGKASAWILY